jgi:uncharacterized protein YjbI with pentapeptide repeats
LDTRETLLLEDLVGAIAAKVNCGAIEVVGERRTGKTTALAHLASLALGEQLGLLDDARPIDVQLSAAKHFVVYTTCRSLGLTGLRYELAPWCRDDLIEYLLSTHPDRCASVMARVTSDDNEVLLEGKPELYCMVAEQMAANEAVPDIRAALRLGIAAITGDQQTLEDARFYSAAVLLGEHPLAQDRQREMRDRGVSSQLFDLLANRWVQILLTADHVASVLKRNAEHLLPAVKLPRALVAETARIAQGDPEVLLCLRRLADGGETQLMPMAASVLHLADPDWRPDRNRCSHLVGAYLSEASWQGIDLHQANLQGADLRRADLRDANLEASRLNEASLRESRLGGARMASVLGFGADFSHADLTHAVLTNGRFFGAHFVRSLLNEASAANADFRCANLECASVAVADLTGCDFRDALLEGADLRDSDLRNANLSEQILRQTLLRGANLASSDLSRCDLEFVELPRACFRDADLSNAWLTGSVIRGADFRKAKLRHAGLADIDWERADLRGADLRGCSFHLGSCRSGLVGSPYPCHGSRTGFYTDDYGDQTYKAPEEIRKANLCGADLRGALIANVDFYLVDLRGAKYDPEQALHFRRCDAILSGRAT